MGDRVAKDALFDAFAEVAKALGNGRRAELIDVLAQGERHVDELASEIDQSIANTSFHLRVLATAGLVTTRRDGTRVYYRLASESVGELWAALREVAAAHHDQLDELAADYLGDRRRLERDRSRGTRRTDRRRRRRGHRRATRSRVRRRPHRRSPLDPHRPARGQHQEPSRGDRGRRLLPRPVLRVRRRRRSPAAPPWTSRPTSRRRLPRMAARQAAGRGRLSVGASGVGRLRAPSTGTCLP